MDARVATCLRDVARLGAAPHVRKAMIAASSSFGCVAGFGAAVATPTAAAAAALRAELGLPSAPDGPSRTFLRVNAHASC